MNTQRILIVDDDPNLRKTLSAILEARGYMPTAVGTGREALERTEEEPPDVALVDLRLEDMPGLEVMQGIKGRSPGTECIVLTGHASQASAIEAINLGAYSYVQKPYDAEQLLVTIRRAIERREAEQTVRRERDRPETYLNIAGVMLVALNDKGDIVLVNRKGCQVLGHAEDALVGRNWFDTCLPAGVRDEVRSVYQRLMAGDIEPVEYYENLVLTSSGVERIIAWHNTVLTDEAGNITGTLSSGEDITERKRADEALRESESFTTKVLESSHAGIYIYDLEQENHLFINQQYIRLTGYTLEDLHAMDGAEFVALRHPDDQPRFAPHFERIAQARDGDIPEIEYRFRVAGGSWIWCLSRDAVFQRDDEGNLQPLIGTFLDVTERKRAESQRDASLEALAAERNLLRTLIDSIPDAIHVKDRKGRFLAGNVALAGHVGVASPDALLGKTDYDFFPEDVAARLYADEQEVIQSGQPSFDREELLVDSSGSRRWVSTVQVPLREPQGDVVGLVGVSRDITERVQAEEERETLQAQLLQSQKMEAVGRLTAGIAHDFNNLLTAINGFAQLIQLRLAPDDPTQEMVGRIWDSGQRAADLVSQLMAFSRKQVIDPQVLDLNAVVRGMDDMLRRMIREDVELKTVLVPDLWPVKVDPTQMEQVIVNLAVNAADAMPSGGTLTIETSNVVLDEAYLADHLGAEPGEHVLLAVSDTGVGMSPEVQEHIFEPFFTTKGLGEGTGLGLATVYGIVQQFGGNILLYSEEGQGTTFKIYLRRAEEPAELSPRGEEAGALPAGGETILLVKDNPGVRDLARQVLEGQGYTLLEAGDGQQALDLAASHAGPIHLLLTDVIMPGMSGSTLSERLIQSLPDVRILYMSGYTEGTIEHHGVGKGVAFVQKPFGPLDLARKVRAVLDG